jgi:hypothetical protein
MVKGQITKTFNTYFKATGPANRPSTYDGTIEIFDTKYNREKIAAHIRGGDLRVSDRQIEKAILAENPPGANKAKKAARFAEMPDGFNGANVVVRAKAMRDSDPFEDIHASDAEFNEVPKAVNKGDASWGVDPEYAANVTVVVPKISAAEQKSGNLPPKATKPPMGTDVRATKKVDAPAQGGAD